MAMDVRRARVIVHGRVQGVWFRESTRREADMRRVNGWVRNRYDGTVEAVFEGNPHAVAQMVAWCRNGPDRAEVTEIEVFEEEPVGVPGFVVRG